MKNLATVVCAFVLFFNLTKSSFSQNVWEPLNGPYGGPVYNLISGNSSFDFCITPSGIYKSSNYGSEWIQSNPVSINNLYTGSMGTNGFVYAATTNYTTLLYRSTDNGNTWEQRLNGGLDFNAVATSPNGTIYAGTFYMFSFHGQFVQDGDIFRSNDNGASWTNVNFPSLAVGSIKINSLNEVFVATTEGLFRSPNGGSFTNVRSGPVGALFINSQNHVFIQTTGSNVLRSTDNGGSWVNVSSGSDLKMPIAYDQSGNLYATSSGTIYRSTDNGIVWNIFSQLPEGNYYEVSSINFKTGGVIMVSTSKGIFRSENNGSSWVRVNTGIRDPQVTSIAVNGDNIFTASRNSVSRSTDNGWSWQISDNGLPISEARIIQAGENGNAFVYIPVHGIYRSANNGDTWIHVENLPPMNVSQLKARQNKVYVTSDNGKIFRSDNNGINWNDITSDLPDSITFNAFSIDQNENLYASVERGSWFTPLKGIYKSVNGGASWNVINEEIAPEEIIVNSQGIVFAKLANGLLRSDNGGANFVLLSSPQEYVIEIAVGSQDQLVVYLAEDKIYQVKKSLNNGLTWTDITGILNNQLVYDLNFDSQSRLIAATQSGVYRTSSPTSVSSSASISLNNFSLKQNYPNPFNPNTILSYDLRVTGYVSLRVFDVTGNEVAILVAHKQNAGKYDVNFNGVNLSSGVYFYSLYVNEQLVDTKKMLLVK